MQALLIIDMQKGAFIPETPRYQSDKVIERIKLLAESFREKNEPVIFIQHDGSKLNNYIPGTEEWEIASGLILNKNDLIIPKTANDSFYKTSLHDELQKRKVSELVITGCATDFCVNAAILSAINHDFNVTVISDAHTTADRPFVHAKQVIDHYNWIWSEYISTEGKITVVDTESYLN